MLPSLFVSHGAPTLPFDDVPARTFLKELGARMEKPRAILIVSAHWDAAPAVTGAAHPGTIHDFHGFPKPLYDLRYPAPGDPALASRVAALTGARIDAARGFDHGAWVPLMLMYPEADIPVVQLSVESAGGAAGVIALGRSLSPLREDGVLVMGSGGFVHNLRALSPPAAPEPDWSRQFGGWIHEHLVARDDVTLTDYRRLAPHAVLAHPSEEHFLPLLAAYGAGGEHVERLHESATFGSLRMDAYAFG